VITFIDPDASDEEFTDNADGSEGSHPNTMPEPLGTNSGSAPPASSNNTAALTREPTIAAIGDLSEEAS
jgi:hypothetical protein